MGQNDNPLFIMPVKPKTHKPVKHITKRHEPPGARASSSYGKGRGGRTWSNLRKRIFERDKYLCQMHLAEGKIQPVSLHGENAGICDHIKPISQGGTDEQNNLQTLCKRCDTIKSSKESNQQAAILPKWMPRPEKQLNVVCGPPRAGKNTYILNNAEPGDMVIDLDMIAEEFELPREHNRSKADINLLIRERNNRLASFCRGKTEHKTCWLISTAGTFKQRKFWEDLGAKVIIINPGKAICKERIMKDKRKKDYVKQIRMKAVDNWK